MGKLRVTYVKSAIGYRQSQKDTVRSLGLRRLNQSVVVDEENRAALGMVEAVRHLVRVEPIEE
ncbi:MAG TPA: 50S ribosomal protein L30 [Chloroflexota bacterium]|nr:50S ribosomal protein L30 [Chloroflexota bacterium]